MVFYVSLLRSLSAVAVLIEVALALTIPYTSQGSLLPRIVNTPQPALQISNKTLQAMQIPDNIGQFLPDCPATNSSGASPRAPQSPTLRQNLFAANFLMHSYSTPMPALFAISATPVGGQEQDGNVYFSSAKLSYLRIDGKVVEISTKTGEWGEWNRPEVKDRENIPGSWDWFQLEELNIQIPDAINDIRQAGWTRPWEYLLIIKQRVVSQRTLWFFQVHQPPYAVVMGDLERRPFPVNNGPALNTDASRSSCVLSGPPQNAVNVT